MPPRTAPWGGTGGPIAEAGHELGSLESLEWGRRGPRRGGPKEGNWLCFALFCFVSLLQLIILEANPTPVPTRESSSSLPTVLQSQVLGLKALYVATDGANWDLAGISDDATVFNTGNPWIFSDTKQENPCSSKWDGISCTQNHDQINVVCLHGKGLVGTLPSEISLLSSLTHLDLSLNSLTGTVPTSIYALVKLGYLDLGTNALQGSIPPLGQVASTLTKLYLNANSFTGQLPAFIFSLTNLKALDLSSNAFHGKLSPLIGKLSSLTYLWLSTNTLSGEIPASLFSLTRLHYLTLYNNAFSGTLSSFVGQLSALTALHLFSNSLNGQLPSALFWLTNLKSLDFHGNSFSGTLPSLGQLSALTFLDVSCNSLTGEQLPATLFLLSNLSTLDIHSNIFRGTLSPSIGQLGALSYLDLSFNKRLSGALPALLFSLTNLKSLDLSGNAFRGTLSSLIGQLSSLTSLYLFSGQLGGQLPATLYALTNLVLLDVSSNTFSGSLSPLLGNLLSLKAFRCGSNRLGGSLPAELAMLPSLEDVLLGGNSFLGALPPFGSPPLLSLDAANNHLSSSLPPALFNISTLESIDLSHNSLSGTIIFPRALKAVNLQLSWNSLTGSIPPSICTNLPEAEYIDVSHNLLSGSPPLCLAHAPKNLHSLSLAANRLTSSSLDFLPQTGNVTLVDISSNSFQGILPSAFFSVNAITLQTFAAASNCLQGSIPPSLCLASRLQTLVLDGLGGGDACRVLVSGASSTGAAFKFTGTTTKSQLQRQEEATLPSCLLTHLPNISTLHVSGNGLSGNVFSSLARWPASLKDLSASHNRLSGTIPAHLQQTMGQFRVFDLANNRLGGLLDQVANLSSSSQINLKVNRFSGQLSPAIVSAPAPIAVLEGNLFGCVTRSQLPDGDAFKPRFECGSDTFNNVLIAFAVVLFAVASLFLSRFRGQLQHWLHPPHPPLPVNTTAVLSRLLVSLSALRHFLFVAAAVFIFLLIPVYGAVSATHGTHSVSYAWTVSAIFVSGEAAAGVFLVFWALLLVAAYYWLISQQQQQQQNNPSLDDMGQLRRWQLIASRLFSFAVNAAFVLPPNIFYVWVVRTQNNQVQTATGLALTVYKQLWGRLALPFLLRQTGRLYGGRHGAGFAYELLLAAFNLILAPALALLTNDSNCFKEALYAPPPIFSSYNTSVDSVSINFHMTLLSGFVRDEHETTIHTSSLVQSELSYVPTFQYGYQCSASLLQAYGPVFLLMALLSCFGEPILLAAMRLLFDRGGARFSFMSKLLPLILLSHEERSQRQRVTNEKGYRVFDAHKLFMAVLQDLLIMLTFGIAAPLLGLAVAMSLCLKILLWHHVLTHISSGSSQAAEDVEADCAEFVSRPHPLFTARWFLVGFSSFFLSFFLVDAAGDVVGWKRAMWAPALMWTLPALVVLVLSRSQLLSAKPALSLDGLSHSATVEVTPLGNRATVGVSLDEVYRKEQDDGESGKGQPDHIPDSLPPSSLVTASPLLYSLDSLEHSKRLEA